MLFPLYDKNPHHRIPWLTLLIIAANVGTMFWLSQLDARKAERVVVEYGFVPKRLTKIDNPQPVVVEIERAPGHFRKNPVPQDKLVLQLPPEPKAIYRSLLTMMFL
ncbi:MAG: cupredoxin domain-containing protein, partial [Gammaproteobacteria bacterium]|nr:cupredoxin domain-containing protein [Gammaproteobacteria bacterium]